MTSRQQSDVLTARNEIVAAPLERACTDQTFELPTGIYAAMAIMFAGFVGVLCFAFREHMAVTAVVLFFLLAAFFAIPALFSLTQLPGNRARAMTWVEFSDKGVATATGRTGMREATVLVLLLPFLILCWAIAVAVIAALV